MKFLNLLLFAGLFGITNGLEDKAETIQALTKMVYDLKGEVEHLRLKIADYSKPCDCTHFENVLEEVAGHLQQNTQNITLNADNIRVLTNMNVECRQQKYYFFFI